MSSKCLMKTMPNDHGFNCIIKFLHLVSEMVLGAHHKVCTQVSVFTCASEENPRCLCSDEGTPVLAKAFEAHRLNAPSQLCVAHGDPPDTSDVATVVPQGAGMMNI